MTISIDRCSVLVAHNDVRLVLTGIGETTPNKDLPCLAADYSYRRFDGLPSQGLVPEWPFLYVLA